MDYAKIALEEYTSEEKSPHFGGRNGKPYWDVNAPQCIYNPAFIFPKIIGAKEYRYTVTDCNGTEYTFMAKRPNSYLTPVWDKLPTGMVTIKVEAQDEWKKQWYLSGVRTVFKADPFPGRDKLPARACSYRESATKALAFVFHDPKVQSWLTDGKPSRNLPVFNFVSKIVGGIVGGMIDYAKLAPEHTEKALQIAKIGADFLIDISYGEDTAIPGIPRTYYYASDEINDASNIPEQRKFMVMMIYPAITGTVYLDLAEATGEQKYRDAALHIAEFYKKTVQPNGSWTLLIDAKTGAPQSHKYCIHFGISRFLRKVATVTGDDRWLEMDKNYFDYIVSSCLDNYDWQGQFEDAEVSDNYSNLSHFTADEMVMYLAKNCADDPEKISDAEYLMRFVEDQFVTWGKFAPYISINTPEEADYWYSPAGLEQYNWYVPIDSSTATIFRTFLELHKATGDPLLLEKACALADSTTRMQNAETGMIPTHWIFQNCMAEMDGWFWFNCHIATARALMDLADFLGE